MVNLGPTLNWADEDYEDDTINVAPNRQPVDINGVSGRKLYVIKASMI